MTNKTSISEPRSILERWLYFMGMAGIALTILLSVIIIISAVKSPASDASIFGGFILGIIGFTAGVCLIALSQIVFYLRIIATRKSGKDVQ